MNVLRGAGSLVGALVGLAISLGMFGLFIGGISYRKDCLTNQGKITKSWTFTWFAPIPYVFRPDDPDCVVHTGTRVALNEVGIAPFEETTATMIANKSVDETTDTETAYWVKLSGALEDYHIRNRTLERKLNANRDGGLTIENLNEAQRSVDMVLTDLRDLDPPPRYAAAHNELVAGMSDAQQHGREMQAAARAQDEQAFRRAHEKTIPDSKRIERAMQRLRAIREGA